MMRCVVVTVGLMATGAGAWSGAGAQAFTLGAHGVAVTHVEVNQDRKSHGFGYGAMLRLRGGRVALDDRDSTARPSGLGYHPSQQSRFDRAGPRTNSRARSTAVPLLRLAGLDRVVEGIRP